MLDTSALVAFVATRDGARSRAFYEKTLQLRLLSDDPYALSFDANGTPLRVQKVDDFTPQPFTVIGWTVPSLDEAVKTLVDRGVRFERYPGMDQDAFGIWSAPGGARVAWFKDPDGNTLSLTELEDARAMGP